MKTKTAFRSKSVRRSLASMALASALLAPSSLRADNFVWTGNGGVGNENWSNCLNWLNGNIPVSGLLTNLSFAGNGTTYNDLDNPFELASETFSLGTFFQKGNGLGFAAGGLLTAQDDAAAYIENNIYVNSFNPALDYLDLKVDASSTMYLDGVISGPTSLTVTGGGTAWLNNANTYSGPTIVNGGTLAVGPNGSIGTGDVQIVTGSLSLGNGQIISNITFGDGQTPSKATLSGAEVFLDGNIDYMGTTGTASAPAVVSNELALPFGNHLVTGNGVASSASPDINLRGPIAGFGSIEIQGTTALIGATSGYTGGTIVDSGATLLLDVANALNPQGGFTDNGVVVFNPSSTNPYVVAGNFNQLFDTVSGTGVIELGSATLQVGDANASSTFSGNITGASGLLQKLGTGTFTLDGLITNTYGNTLINSGSLIVSGNNLLGGGDVSVVNGLLSLNDDNDRADNLSFGDGSTTSPGSIAGTGSITVAGNFTYNGAPNNASAPSGIDIPIILSAGNHLVKDNGNTPANTPGINFVGSVTGPGGLEIQTDTLLSGTNTYLGATTVDPQGSLTLDSTNALPTNTALNVAGSVTLDPGVQAQSPFLTPGDFNQTVGSLSGTGILNLGSATLTVGTNNTNSTFSGHLYGSAGEFGTLVKVGTGMLTIGSSAASSMNFNTVVDGGELSVGPNADLGQGTIQVTSGLLDLNAFNVHVTNLSFGDGVTSTPGSITGPGPGGGSLYLSGNVTYNGNPSGTSAPTVIQGVYITLGPGNHVLSNNGFETAQSPDITLDSSIVGDPTTEQEGFPAGGLEFQDGTFAIGARSGYTGSTKIDAGATVYLDSLLALFSSSSVLDDGSLVLDPGSLNPYVTAGTFDEPIQNLSGSGSIALGDATLSAYEQTANATFSGAISGEGTLSKFGSYTLTLTGANDIGQTVDSAGTLVGTTVSLSNNVVDGAEVDFAQTFNGKFGGAITGGGLLNIDGPGTVDMTESGSLAQFVGQIGVIGGTLVTTSNELNVGTTVGSSGALEIAQSFDGALVGPILGDGKLVIDGTGTIDATNPSSLQSFSGNLDIQSGTLVTNAQTLFVNPTIEAGGTLEFDEPVTASLGVTLGGDGTFLKTGAGTLNANQQIFQGDTVVNGGTLALNGVSWTSVGGVQIGGGGTIRLETHDAGLFGGTLQNSGMLSGSGTVGNSLQNTATGEVFLGNSDNLEFEGQSNSNAGLISVTGGAIQFDSGLTNDGLVQIGGGTLQSNGTLTNDATGFISGRGTIQGLPSTPGGYSIVNYGAIGLSGGVIDVYGDLENLGAGTIVNAGGGVLTFYGNVEQNGGAIRTDAGSYTVFFGNEGGAGNFTGSGTVEFDGNLHPGNSPDIVHYGGDVVLGDKSVTQMLIVGTQPGTGYDQMIVAGNTYLNGDLDVTLGRGFMPSANEQFDLISGVTIGNFTSLDLPSLGNGLIWSYTSGPSGFVLTAHPMATPEPSAFAAFGLGLVGLSASRRRKSVGQRRRSLTRI